MDVQFQSVRLESDSIRMQAEVFGHSVEQPSSAGVIQVLIKVDAERSFLPGVMLMILGGMNNTPVKSLSSHEFLN
jgi:hypothetical protein